MGPLRAAIAGFTVMVLAITVILGTFLGSSSRERHEADLLSVAAQEQKADDEFSVRLYRKGMGIPEAVPQPAPPAP